ncbi:MAG: outer membrane beta-barrel protein [Pseudomonadota bacterium]
MKHQVGSLLAMAFAAGAGATAIAQDSAPEDGLYLRVGGGVTFAKDLEQSYVFNPDLVFAGGPPTGQTVSTDTGYIAGGALGFDYADGIRTELEYRYASTSIDTVVVEDFMGPTTVTPAEDSLGVHFLIPNFYFDFTNATPLTPFIGGGVGGAIATNENGDKDAAVAWQARGGVSLELGDQLFIDAEYIFVRTFGLEFGPEVEDFTPTGPFEPRVEGDRYVASNAMISIRKHF